MAASSSERSTTVVESHTLLDVPDDVAEQLHAWLAGGANADVRLAVEEDKNVATLKVNGHSLSAAFTTLPTVVETHASLDGVTFYKSGEVGKMLVARHSPDDLPRVVTGEVPSAPADAELMPEQPDGLTAPTANIRKKMWRKRPPRDPKDVEQVAIELEALRGGSLKPEFELVTRRETRTDFVNIEPPAGSLKLNLKLQPPPSQPPPPHQHSQASQPPMQQQRPPPSMAQQPPTPQAIAPQKIRLVVNPSVPPQRQPPPPQQHMQQQHTQMQAQQQMQAPPQQQQTQQQQMQQQQMRMQQQQQQQRPPPAAADPAAMAAQRAQAQAELTQIDPQIAKFRKMATNVSNPDQRRQIQAKIQALEKQRAAVLARAQGS